MAKAQFHRNQKVWVETVGTWAVIDKVAPVWAKGFDEPVRITYDVGLGRDFLAHELSAEDRSEGGDVDKSRWRVLRARNKWQSAEDCGHHPYPGSFPVVVTDVTDWGGWRTPGAEYDRDPWRIERQARLIAAAPALLDLARELIALAKESPDDAPAPLLRLAERAVEIDRRLSDEHAAPATGQALAAE